MDDAITRRRIAAGIQTPSPTSIEFCCTRGDRRGLQHDEVITLFHEFGMACTSLLTQVEDLGVSGSNGWNDAVELPSQFMKISAGSGMSQNLTGM